MWLLQRARSATESRGSRVKPEMLKKTRTYRWQVFLLYGRGERIRTSDLLHPMQFQ